MVKIRKEQELKIWLKDHRYNKEIHGLVLENHEDLPCYVKSRIRKLGLSVMVMNRRPYGSIIEKRKERERVKQG